MADGYCAEERFKELKRIEMIKQLGTRMFIPLLRICRLQLTSWKKLFPNLMMVLSSLANSAQTLTVRHLAELKHNVPGLIIVKKIRVQYEEIVCMKEDLLISLETHVVETDKTLPQMKLMLISSSIAHFHELFG